MSVSASKWVYSLDIDAAPKTTLAAMAECLNEQTERCNPSVATLARMTSKSVRTINRHIQWLIEHKLITQVRGRRAAASYKLECQTGTSEQPERVPAPVAAEGQNGVILETPKAGQNGASYEPRSGKSDKQEATLCPPIEKNQKREPERKKDNKRTASRGVVDIDGFRSVFEGVFTAEIVDGLIATRKAKRGTVITAYAAKLLLESLRQFTDPEAVAKKMILRGWVGIEPEWLDNRRTQPQQRGARTAEPKEPNVFQLCAIASRRAGGVP